MFLCLFGCFPIGKRVESHFTRTHAALASPGKRINWCARRWWLGRQVTLKFYFYLFFFTCVRWKTCSKGETRKRRRELVMKVRGRNKERRGRLSGTSLALFVHPTGTLNLNMASRGSSSELVQPRPPSFVACWSPKTKYILAYFVCFAVLRSWLFICSCPKCFLRVLLYIESTSLERRNNSNIPLWFCSAKLHSNILNS